MLRGTIRNRSLPKTAPARVTRPSTSSTLLKGSNSASRIVTTKTMTARPSILGRLTSGGTTRRSERHHIPRHRRHHFDGSAMIRTRVTAPLLTSTTTRKEEVHTHTITVLPTGEHVKLATNDITDGETKERYIERSLGEFETTLENDTLYFVLDRSLLRKDLLTSGHLACFVTSESGSIIEESFMSVRRDRSKKLRDSMLLYKLPHDPTARERRSSYYRIEFYSSREELTTFFNNAGTVNPKDNTLKIVGIPMRKIDLTTAEIIENVSAYKKAKRHAPYIIASGRDSETSLPELVDNCVTSVLSILNVRNYATLIRTELSSQLGLCHTLHDKRGKEVTRSIIDVSDDALILGGEGDVRGEELKRAFRI